MKGSRNIGINSLAQSLKRIFSEKKKSNEDSFVEKVYEGTEDNFVDETNKNLRAMLNLDKKTKTMNRIQKPFVIKMHKQYFNEVKKHFR